MAVAAASFSTLMLAMSSGLMFSSCENCSSLAFFTSKLVMSTFHVLPFTTMSGLELVSVLTDDVPLRRMLVPAPRFPDTDTMSRPDILPCRASSTVVMAMPSNSFMSIVCDANDFSRSGMASPLPFTRFFDVMVTSSIIMSDSIFTLYTVLLIGIFNVL